MFLASFDVLRPIAGPGSLVVQKSTDAQLLGGGSVPAGPIPGARCLVAENTIKPVAMVGWNRWIGLTFSIAIVRSPGVVAALGYTAMFASENKTVWTVEQLWTSIHTLPITIAVLYVTHDPRFCLAGVFLLLLLAERSLKQSVLVSLHRVCTVYAPRVTKYATSRLQAQPARSRSNVQTTLDSIRITYPKTATTSTTSTAARGRNSSQLSARPIARDSTVSSPTRRNATFSGIAGTESPPGTSAVPDSLTTVKPESACGLIKYLNAKTKVGPNGANECIVRRIRNSPRGEWSDQLV